MTTGFARGCSWCSEDTRTPKYDGSTHWPGQKRRSDSGTTLYALNTARLNEIQYRICINIYYVAFGHVFVCVCVQVCTSCRCVWVRTKIMKPCMILCVNMYSVDVLNQYSLNMPLHVVVWVSSRLHRLSHKLVRTWLGWDWRRTQTRAPSICEDCGEHKPTGNESIYWHHRYLMANRAAAMCRTVMHLGQ